MDTLPAGFSGTLKVRSCHVFWAKTPVQLTYHRQDYRQALPVLLIRRSNLLGREFRIPLDPCIHPVRLLPTSSRMASKLEFAIAFGWRTKQVRFRAPDAATYLQWTGIVKSALVSGRRPLPTCGAEATTACARQNVECSSLASTLNSSINSQNVTFHQRVPTLDDRQRHARECCHRREIPYESPTASNHPAISPISLDRPLFNSAAIGSCDHNRPQSGAHVDETDQNYWLSSSIPSDSNSASIINELLGHTKFWFALL